MKVVFLLLVIASVSASLANAYTSPRSRLARRQIAACTSQQIDDILGADYPNQCADAFRSIELVLKDSSSSNLEIATSVRANSFICEPRCLDVAARAIKLCISAELSTFVFDLCDFNAGDVWCYEEEIVSAVDTVNSECDVSAGTECSPSCITELQSAIESVGCCITLLNFGRSYDLARFYSSCDIDQPLQCGETPPNLSCTLQEVEDVLGADYPSDCAEAFENIEPVLKQYRSSVEVAAKVRDNSIICESKCFTQAEKAVKRCINDDLSTFLYDLCSINENGDACFKENIISATEPSDMPSCNFSSTTCSSSCKSELQTTMDTVGCCIILLDVGGLEYLGDFYAGCSLLEPIPCEVGIFSTPESTISGAASTAMSIFVLVVALAVGIF